MPLSSGALHDFLSQHCEVKSIATGAGGGKERCYVFNTEDCVLFLAEVHIQQMRDAVGQTDDVLAFAKKTGDYTGIIMAYNWGAPEPGMDTIRIPVRLVETLDSRQSALLLRNLQGILIDITEGKQLSKALQALLGDAGKVKAQNNLDGERIFLISSKGSAAERKNYAERFAEQVATNVLFDLPKALNAQIQTLLPKEYRGRYFVEGRDITSKKLRYGAEANIEIVLTNAGALVYAQLSKEDPKLAKILAKVIQQAMTDPFGLSMKHYMGKHAVIKLSGKDEDDE
jgi:hypothetical protein